MANIADFKSQLMGGGARANQFRAYLHFPSYVPVGPFEGLTDPSDYQVDLEVHQLDRNGRTLKVYKFADAYPTSIGAISLDYDQANQIETFDVEFTYNYFTSNIGTDTDGSSFGVNLSIDTAAGTFPVNIPL